MKEGTSIGSLSVPAAEADRSELGSLAELVAARRVVLFAGAGLSMAVGLPSWGALIERMCRDLELDVEHFGQPASYPALAEYYAIRHGSLSPLARWMREEWQVSDEAVAASQIHQLIVQLDFPLIYTTNYDANLERAFTVHGRRCVVIRHAGDLAASRGGATEVIKFHGDLDDEDSLVLAESDYFARLQFESPLDIKFRADALDRSVLFLGYSMSDMNIRLMLFRLWEIWRHSGLEEHRPPSFLFSSRPDPVQAALLDRRGIQMVTGASSDPQTALTEFLAELARRVEELRAGGTVSASAD